MKHLGSFVLLLLLTTCSIAQPTIAIPEEVKGQVGQFLKIPAKSSGEVRWFSVDTGLSLFPVELLKDSKTAVIVAMNPGRYRLLAWTAEGGTPSDAVVCWIVIGDPPPPTPTPTPPGPTPGPVDPLTSRIQQLYNSDPSSTKAADKAVLAAIFRQGAETQIRDVTLKTAADLQVRLRLATDNAIPNRLVQIRQALWNEVIGILPSDQTQLTETKRGEVAQAFYRFAGILDQVK